MDGARVPWSIRIFNGRVCSAGAISVKYLCVLQMCERSSGRRLVDDTVFDRRVAGDLQKSAHGILRITLMFHPHIGKAPPVLIGVTCDLLIANTHALLRCYPRREKTYRDEHIQTYEAAQQVHIIVTRRLSLINDQI